MTLQVIWKFPVPVRAEPTMVAMPIGARILSVQTQREEICIWALVDPDEDREERRFLVVATGQTFDPTGMDYLGTVQINGGIRIFHVWEIASKQ